MKSGEDMIIKLHFNVSRKNKENSYQPYSIITYDFFVYNIDKEEKIDFIERFIQKHEQYIIDTAVFSVPNGTFCNISSNNDIKTEIKSYL